MVIASFNLCIIKALTANCHRLESLCEGWIPNSNSKSFAASAECCSRDEMKLLLHQIFLSCDTF